MYWMLTLWLDAGLSLLVKFLAFFLSFFRAALLHMEVARLGVKLELQLPAYTTAHSNARFELRL